MKKIITILFISLFAFPTYITSAHAESEIPLRFETFRDYGHYLVVEEWGEEYWESFEKIIQKESSWKITGDHYIDNKVYVKDPNSVPNGITLKQDTKGYYFISTASGLGGFLNSTWSTVGCEKTTDGFIQLECTVGYIKNRYGDPNKAFEYHSLNNHY